MLKQNLLVLDTCEWLYLTEARHPGGLVADDLLFAIEHLVNIGKIEILVPSVVQNEWNRSQEGLVDERVKGEKKNLSDVYERLQPYEDVGVVIRLREWLKKAKSDDEFLRPRINDAITRINRLLSAARHQAPSDWAKFEAIDLGLHKKAPFGRSGEKNGVADALIFLTAIEYLKENRKKYESAYFVTYNTSDFSQSNDEKNTLHEDLIPYAEQVGLQYSTNIGQAINNIQPGLVKPETIKRLQNRLTYGTYLSRFGAIHPIQSGSITIPCPKCWREATFDATYTVRKRGPYGYTLWYVCPICRQAAFDSGDRFD